MKRFRTLQWQLTAAYTLISLIVLLIVFLGGGYGFALYRILSNSFAWELYGGLEIALARTHLDESAAALTPNQLADRVFEKVVLNCELVSGSTGATTTIPLTDSDEPQTCPTNRVIHVAFETAEAHLQTYVDLNSLKIWFPDGSIITVDRSGRHVRDVRRTPFEERVIAAYERGDMSPDMIWPVDHRGLNTQVAVPILHPSAAEALADAIRRAAQGEAVLHPRIAARVVQELHGTRTEEADPFVELSEREIEVLKLIADGQSNADIAEKLVISTKTVKRHVSNILSKLHVGDRTQAAVYAWREGMMRGEDGASV